MGKEAQSPSAWAIAGGLSNLTLRAKSGDKELHEENLGAFVLDLDRMLWQRE
jgi:hypothetical protein